MAVDEELIRRIVRETVRETLSSFGVDVENPRDVQADFAAIREYRLAMRSVPKVILGGVTLTILTGALTALWIGVKSLLK